MARVDEAPEERDQHPLVLSQLEECPNCAELQEVTFQAAEGTYDLEDLIEVPEGLATCIACDFEWDVSYSGWVSSEEAG